MKNFKYILTSFIRMLLLIILVCIVTFTLAVNSPLDPIRQYVGEGVTVSVEQREDIAEYWGLNDTKVERFQKWFKNILNGDFGESTIFRRGVLDVIKFPSTTTSSVSI